MFLVSFPVNREPMTRLIKSENHDRAEMRFRLQWQISVCITLILCWVTGAFLLARQKQQMARGFWVFERAD